MQEFSTSDMQTAIRPIPLDYEWIYGFSCRWTVNCV